VGGGGGINHTVRRFSKFKKMGNQNYQIQEWETHVGNCFKDWIHYPYTQNIFSLYQHSVHTRFKTNLHPPIANLTKFQKGVYYSGIKIFRNLLHDIKDMANETTPFRNALKTFLLINSIYNSEEYFNYQR
jgi:hypothetical protein